MRYLRPVYAVALLPLLPAIAQVTSNGRATLILESKSAKLGIDLGGGSIFDFHLAESPLNPLTWDSKGEKGDPRAMGHFLCLDRWGAPSAAEQRNGMPFHGEASKVAWRVLNTPSPKGSKIEAEMAAALPMAGLEVTRRIRLSREAAFFTVVERVTNRNKLGRIYNMVQHPTIAPPFLDDKTLVDANASKGFMQSSPLPDPEKPAVEWPQAVNTSLKDSSSVDMRRLATDPDPNVVSYTIEDEHGWTTASSPSSGLLIGYIWKTADYPWFNAWRHVESGKPAARGLEFGTTGLHQPFPILVKKGRIFDRPLYSYLDAGESAARSYACFLFRIPKDYKGVAKITYAAGRLRLQEHAGGAGRELTMEVGDLFPE
jgi:hypothetical protein